MGTLYYNYEQLFSSISKNPSMEKKIILVGRKASHGKGPPSSSQKRELNKKDVRVYIIPSLFTPLALVRPTVRRRRTKKWASNSAFIQRRADTRTENRTSVSEIFVNTYLLRTVVLPAWSPPIG